MVAHGDHGWYCATKRQRESIFFLDICDVKRYDALVFGSNRTFSTSQVARIAGLTQRQCQWYDEKGIVSALHVGHARQYTRQEAIEACVIGELRRKGMPLRSVRTVLPLAKPWIQRHGGATELLMATDGHVAAFGGALRIIEVTVAEQAPMYVVSISELARKVDGTRRPDGAKNQFQGSIKESWRR